MAKLPGIPHVQAVRALEKVGFRINAQWRICFVWREGNAYDVEITDYH